MSKNIVVKDNALINASYHLDLIEQRLILLAVIEANRNERKINSNDFLTIYADRYINEFKVHRNVAYQVLKEACLNLFERRFTYQKLTEKGNKENVTSRWVQSISYVENEGIVRLKFSDDVAPLIQNLEKHFTSYDLEQVAGLNSKYAVRLYEIVIAWRSVGKTPMIAVDELKNRLGLLDSEYIKMEVFKRRVLDFSKEQINEKTNITIDYEQHKQGRKIIGFTFSIKAKKQIDTTTEKVKNQATGLSEKQANYFGSKLANDASFGSEYAPMGMGMDEFACYVASELKNADKVTKYMDYLKKHGYAEK